jgi:multiple sugar transport system permease protein
MKAKRVIYVVAVVMLLWSMLPIYWLLNYSLMFAEELSSSPAHLYPNSPTLTNYLRIIPFIKTYDPYSGKVMETGGHAETIRLGLINSAIIAVAVTAITIAVSSPAGYVFGRMKFRHKNKLLFTLVGSRSLPAISILIPYYFFYLQTKLNGTLIGLILIHLSITVPITTWVLMGFFATLPVEAEKSARIDGCSRIKAFRKVVLPMATSGIAACAILSFLMSWNEYVFAWVLNAGTVATTLPPALANLFWMHSETELMSAASMIGMVPAIGVAFLFQRYVQRLNIVDPVAPVGL